MPRALSMLTDAFGVVVDGLALVVKHLPVLVVLYLLGATGRGAVLWAAVEVSAVQPTVAGLMLPLAPLSTLVAFVLMLRVVGRSLRHARFGATADQAATPVGVRLTILASTLIPFLTVYAAQGYLQEDVRVFVNEASYDELFGSARSFYGESADIGRAAVASGSLLVGLVLVALVLRFLLTRFDLPRKHVAFGGLAAYVEVLWLVLLARQFTQYQDTAWQWVLDRRSVHAVQSWWGQLVDGLGALGEPLARTVSAIGTFIDSSDDILLIPVAWLTVGAVALGTSVAAPRRAPVARPWERYTNRVPTRVRSWGGELTSDFTGRFRGLANGVRLLAVGGLLPMILFCLVFVLARQAGLGVGEVWRMVVGPVDSATGTAFAPWRGLVTTGVEYVVLAGLLAAAVDRIVGRAQQRVEEQDSRDDDQPISSST